MDTADWCDDWLPLRGLLGRDLFTLPEHGHWGTPHDVVRWAPERVDRSAIRRFLEPLEFTCPLHDDPEEAKRLGHDNLLVPLAALRAFTISAVWQPGQDSAFLDNSRDALPTSGGFGSYRSFPFTLPKYSGVFATEADVDLKQDVFCGALLGRRGSLLLEVLPKLLRIGRGCFIKWQSELVDERLNILAIFRTQVFVYEPKR